MIWVYYILLLLTVLIGLVLAAFTLPGLWLMTGAAAIYAVLTQHRDLVGAKTLISLFVLSLLGEILEIVLTGAAAKKAGGGRGAMFGGVAGGIVGGILFSFVPIPVIATIVGICVGSFAGAAGVELIGGRETGHSLRVGVGAAKGRFMGIVSKVGLGVVMGVIIFFAGFPR